MSPSTVFPNLRRIATAGRSPHPDQSPRRSAHVKQSGPVVGRLFRLEIDSTIRATAAAFAEPTLRSLDAIHLATAQVLTNESGTALIAFVTYDRRLLESAKAAGLPVASPGQN
ncbi:MAG: uncharacterized protein QOH97_67 [Actinoplanes sp.]|nr:uncharacterized protein [Actinoplanes sp.]